MGSLSPQRGSAFITGGQFLFHAPTKCRPIGVSHQQHFCCERKDGNESTCGWRKDVWNWENRNRFMNEEKNHVKKTTSGRKRSWNGKIHRADVWEEDGPLWWKQTKLFLFSFSFYCFLGLILDLCLQVSTGWPGGEDPGDRPERLQHGRQGGANPAEQHGANQRWTFTLCLKL